MTQTTDFDVLILGGGPAGISALLWSHSLGLRAALLEPATELGGQMLQMFHRLYDYAGLPGLTGREMRDQFVAHLAELQLDYRVGCQLTELQLAARQLRCNGVTLRARALILATGARKRRLGIPGEEQFEMRGVSFSATRDHSLYAGKPVTVIGGGDSAVENALILSRVCPQVTLVHHSEQFRARPEWLNEAQHTANIRFITHAKPLAITGQTYAEWLLLEDVRTGQQQTLATEGVFIRVGIAPNTESFAGQIALDEAGYLKTNDRQQTSLAGVYGAGDVCRPVCLSVANAVGQGALAAKSITVWLRAA